MYNRAMSSVLSFFSERKYVNSLCRTFLFAFVVVVLIVGVVVAVAVAVAVAYVF